MARKRPSGKAGLFEVELFLQLAPFDVALLYVLHLLVHVGALQKTVRQKKNQSPKKAKFDRNCFDEQSNSDLQKEVQKL